MLPKEYIDSTYGVRPGPNQESFNNIVYSVWYSVAKIRKGNLTNDELVMLERHLRLNNTPEGLYKPKNSHDNITYKVVAAKVFGLPYISSMNFWRAIKDIGIFRIWDVVTYGAVFGPKLLRPFFKMMLWLPALQMIYACATAGKVRPMMFGDGEHSRYKWWFRKKLQLVEHNDNMTIKHWILPDGSKRATRHMTNDGKHLAIFRLFALKDLPFFGLCARICRRILIKRYGPDYTYEIINRHFLDRNHPIIPLWKDQGDLLK